MTQHVLFPGYIPRQEERVIRQELIEVQRDGKSRAVLLYGLSGVGKTSLVRELERGSAPDESVAWLDPIDIDDPEYWLLSNLERRVADRLDPDNRYFDEYRKYLSRLPRYTRSRVGHDAVTSHLGQIKRVFIECYNNFISSSGKTVVIIFDTVEVIRGMYLLLTITQWMKALPEGTLFILSGRPPLDRNQQDPIKRELDDPYQPLPVQPIYLGKFTQFAAFDYIGGSSVSRGLSGDEKAKLVRLTRGYPLWLAFTIAYLDEKGMPKEADEPPLTDIERDMPYEGDMGREGLMRHEAFKRRLVTPYREADFWHEAVKRLAVVRQGMSQPIWERIMEDVPLPPEAADLGEAWRILLRRPWIRMRANGRLVTLHDGVAEELAQRIIPLHDQGGQWRRQLWKQASDIYREFSERFETLYRTKTAALASRFQGLDERLRIEGEPHPSAEEAESFIDAVEQLDADERELDQLVVTHLYYRLLSDREGGCQEFLQLFEKARDEHNVLFQELLAMEVQRFLPGGADPYAFGDVIGGAIDEFRDWLKYTRPDLHLDIGMNIAEYLVSNEQPQPAAEILEGLPSERADHAQRYRLALLRGNAYMRIPTQVHNGLQHFQQALGEAETLTTANRQKFIAEAYKELGFYYRNKGLWRKADEAYQKARDAILVTLSAEASDEDREEMASIQTNWAYVKGLIGSYRDGANLVESAITVRHRLNKHQAEGISWSVCGEVYRYERRFELAWNAYAEAERIFHAQQNWPWLGIIYQEQAICLVQAAEDGITLDPARDPVKDPERDPVARAKRRITLALDICAEQNHRAYPSALNRAGRIFGQEDTAFGLRLLTTGIHEAQRLSDGWFWFANLIEHAELSYQAWVDTDTRDPRYREEIDRHEVDIQQAKREYEFPDLIGRWNLLHGHLGVRDFLNSQDPSFLPAALENYKSGFALIAQGYVGSSGASAIRREFEIFKGLFSQLPPSTQTEWQNQLRSAWTGPESGSTLLLARLEELY
ncbi:MAG TPA: AAA family ATPase [Streptosporangiaceae bacterium]|nr:AAA family ATPase [Streptosporangiaceae bacterium]